MDSQLEFFIATMTNAWSSIRLEKARFGSWFVFDTGRPRKFGACNGLAYNGISAIRYSGNAKWHGDEIQEKSLPESTQIIVYRGNADEEST